MENIKTDINELVKLVRYYREAGKDVLNRFSLHTVFTGNPGTGKTTVARIIGKIYKALGLLERGHIVETGREGLIAGFIGQTALKTKEKLEMNETDGLIRVNLAFNKGADDYKLGENNYLRTLAEKAALFNRRPDIGTHEDTKLQGRKFRR